MPLRIEDYALIGDCETASLVGRDGSIDWLCWPRFDSGACFAALLGGPEHGHWVIAPAGEVKRNKRRYQKHTLILETDFETAEGAVTIIDFMPIRERHRDLIRIVCGRRGQVPMKLELTLRFDYGRSVPWVTSLDDGTLRAVAGPNMVSLRTPVPLKGEDLKTVSEFTVNEGQRIPFVIASDSPLIDRAKMQQHYLRILRQPAFGRFNQRLEGINAISLSRGERCYNNDGRAFIDNPQSAHLSSHGRNHRRTHDFITGATRRKA